MKISYGSVAAGLVLAINSTAVTQANAADDPKPIMRDIGLVGVFSEVCERAVEQGGVRIAFSAPLVGNPTRTLTYRFPTQANPSAIDTVTERIVEAAKVGADRISIVTENAAQRTTTVLQKVAPDRFRVISVRSPNPRLDVSEGVMTNGARTAVWRKCNN